jgi:hypothetical protein
MAIKQHLSRKGPRRIMDRVRLAYQRARQFLALPACFRRARAFAECPRKGAALAGDLLTLFFFHKTFPDHYTLCRLWEVDREDWRYYYGSNYHPHQRTRMAAALGQPEYSTMFIDNFLCTMYGRGMGIPGPRTFGILDPADNFRARIRSWLEDVPDHALMVKPLFGRSGMGTVLSPAATGTPSASKGSNSLCPWKTSRSGTDRSFRRWFDNGRRWPHSPRSRSIRSGSTSC